MAIKNSIDTQLPIPIEDGGTGKTTRQESIDVLSNVSSATSGQVLTKDGSGNATFQNINYTNSLLTISDNQTITGQKTFTQEILGDTKGSVTTSLLKVQRSYGNVNEQTTINHEDGGLYFYTINDEDTCRVEFYLNATDTETGGGANPSHQYLTIIGQKGDTTTDTISLLAKNLTAGKVTNLFLSASSGNVISDSTITLGGSANYGLWQNNATDTVHPDDNRGKLQYYNHRWNLFSGSNSNEIVRFGRSSTVLSYIANNGTFVGNVQGNVQGTLTGDITGNAVTVTNGVYTNTVQTITGEKTFSNRIKLSQDSIGFWQESMPSTSSFGNPGDGYGKLHYFNNRWYLASGSDSGEIVRFRRGSSDKSYINNDGDYVGDVQGNAATVTNGVYTNTTQTITGYKTFSNSLMVSGTSNGAEALWVSRSSSFLEALAIYLLDNDCYLRYYNDEPDSNVVFYFSHNNTLSDSSISLTSNSNGNGITSSKDLYLESSAVGGSIHSNTIYNDPAVGSTPNLRIGQLGRIGIISSKRELKKDFEPVSSELANKILQLQPTLFRFKSQTEQDEKQLGLIAEDVAEVDIKFADCEISEDGEVTPIGVQWFPIVAGLIKLVQDLEERISVLENNQK